MFFNLVTAGFDDFINFCRECLIGFFTDKRLGSDVYRVFFGCRDAFHRLGRLDGGLPVVLAEMVETLDVIGQHQETGGDFRAVSGKSRIHAMLRHTLAQGAHACNDGFCQGDSFVLPHQGQATADFREFVAEDVNAAGLGTFQPFDELPFDGSDVAPHFVPDTRQ